MNTQRPVGRSGLTTPPLVLGGNVFGWTADRDTSFAVLDAFVAGGGTTIDTADVYSAWIPGHVGDARGEWVGVYLDEFGLGVLAALDRAATETGQLAGAMNMRLNAKQVAALDEASRRPE